jgi:hypothetical protein
MQKVFIKPLPNATRRTKTRIGSHGKQGFTLRKQDPSSVFGGSWVLLDAPDGWFGWLPCAEITIEPQVPENK